MTDDLVTLTCPCGAAFQATLRGSRAGRKWCSGRCMDRHTAFGEKRIEYLREYRKKRKVA